MATVTGTLTDIGMGHLTGKSPTILFTLNDANSMGASIIPTEPKRVSPASDGSWSVDLAPTSSMLQSSAFYQITIQWVESEGPGTGVRADWDRLRFVVPSTGGNVGDLINQTTAGDHVWVSPTAVDPNAYSGFQLNTTTYDLYQWQE